MKKILILLMAALMVSSPAFLDAMEPEEEPTSMEAEPESENASETEESQRPVSTRPAKVARTGEFTIKTEPEAQAPASAPEPETVPELILEELSELTASAPLTPATPQAEPRVAQELIAVMQVTRSLAENAQGPTKQARLYDAAQKIRTYLLSLKESESISRAATLDAITTLAQLYTTNDITAAAVALSTPLAGQAIFNWLNTTTQTFKRTIAVENLLNALSDRDDERVRFLIDNLPNAIFGLTNFFGISPLHVAVTYGYLPVVNKAIAAGANVNALDAAGHTPLMLAIVTRNMLIMERLLTTPGINVNMRNPRGQTALMIARMYNLPDFVERLSRVPGIDLSNIAQPAPQRPSAGSMLPPPTTSAQSAAAAAREAAEAHARTMQAQRMAPPLSQPPAQPLTFPAYKPAAPQPIKFPAPAYKPAAQPTIAVPAGQIAPFPGLSPAYAPQVAPVVPLAPAPERTAPAGKSYLIYIAALNGDIEELKKLLPSQTINRKFGRGNKNALMAAAENGHVEIVRLLLAQPNIEVNQQDAFGRTALDFARASISPHKQAVIDLLLATPGIQTESVATRLVGARKPRASVQTSSSPAPAPFVAPAVPAAPVAQPQERQTNLGAQLYNAVGMADNAEVERLLAAGADVNYQAGAPQWTPLMAAIRRGNLTLVRRLLDTPGIDINRKSTAQKTALQIAQESPSFYQNEIIKLLQERGAQ